jgi:hypothetical protein
VEEEIVLGGKKRNGNFLLIPAKRNSTLSGEIIAVGKFVTLIASRIQTVQQLSANGLQVIQYQSIRNSRFQQVSI